MDFDDAIDAELGALVSSIRSGELMPLEEIPHSSAVFHYEDTSLHSGIARAIIRGDLETIKELVAQGKNVKTIDNNGNTPLHVAVLTSSEQNIDIIMYLLSVEDIDINATNFHGQTPLLISTIAMKEFAAFKLLEAGANAAKPSNEDVTPLHYSVRFSTKLTEALVLAGGDINYADYSGYTPLHETVVHGHIEVLCMLLYYNADTTMRSSGGLTPFMLALVMSRFEHADELFEYVVDFNLVTTENMSTLFLAVSSSYPRIIEMIERGADVNHKTSSFNIFNLGTSLRPEVFIVIWNLFDYKEIWKDYWPSILIYILKHHSTDAEYKQTILSCIFENENLQKTIDLVEDSRRYPLIYPLVNNLFLMKASYETVSNFCTILLTSNVIVYDIDLDMVYERYGYCQLFELMLFMDIKETGYKKFSQFPSLIYRFRKNHCTSRQISKSYCDVPLSGMDFENLFRHVIHPQVITFVRASINNEVPDFIKIELLDYVDRYPKVPKLSDLARNRTRDYLCKKYCVQSSCQFYTLLKQLNLPCIVKKLIAFQIPIYEVHQTPEYLTDLKHQTLKENEILILHSFF